MEIIPNFHQVDGVNGNCYIVAREAGLVLVDTGLRGNAKRIERYIRDQLHRSPSEIRTIVLTHFHMDHIGNVLPLRASSGARVAIHEADAPYVLGERDLPTYGGGRGFLLRAVSLFMKPGPIRPDILLRDGMEIAGFACVHTPCHTPGSICLYDPVAKVLVSGDLIRYDGTTVQGPVEQFTPDMIAARRSLQKVAALDFDALLPGHGVPLVGQAAEKVRAFVRSLPG